MRSVVFVAPYALDSTLRFVRAAAGMEGVRLGVVSQEPAKAFARKLGKERAARVAAHVRVKDALDADQLERAVREAGGALGGRVDVLLGILETLQEPLALVRERLGIRGMDAAEAKRFRDKAHMKQVLRARELPCARHCLATSAEQALAFADELLPLVAKPPAGAGAIDTFRVEERAQLESWLRTVPPSPAKPLLLEEFVRGREHSFDSVSIDGEHVFHSISSYAPTPLQVMEAPWIQWTVLLPRSIDGPEYEAIRAAGPAALTALGMVDGMTHMEWFRRADGSIAISEVAARPPGAQFTSLISYAHERDFYRAWAEVSVFGRFDPPERRFAAGAAYLRGQGTGDVLAVEGLGQIERELGELIVEAKLPRPGQKKASSYEGEGYVILRHPETAVVAEGLERVVATLRVQLGAEQKS
jgi:biotin carboxylase